MADIEQLFILFVALLLLIHFIWRRGNVMTTLFGRVEAFEETAETWEHYMERLGHYFEVNGIGNESAGDKAKRRAILLILIQDHSAPKPSEIVQRFRFNNRFRNEGKSMADFVAALRNLAEHCGYNDTLENMLRDRIVCGIKNEKIQRRLLVEKELTFQKAFEIATSMEITTKNMAVLQEANLSEAVNQVTMQADGTKTRKKWTDDRRTPKKVCVLGAEGIIVHKHACLRNCTLSNKEAILLTDVQIVPEVSPGVRGKDFNRTKVIKVDTWFNRGQVTCTS